MAKTRVPFVDVLRGLAILELGYDPFAGRPGMLGDVRRLDRRGCDALSAVSLVFAPQAAPQR
jgi:hypothetical protein